MPAYRMSQTASDTPRLRPWTRTTCEGIDHASVTTTLRGVSARVRSSRPTGPGSRSPNHHRSRAAALPARPTTTRIRPATVPIRPEAVIRRTTATRRRMATRRTATRPAMATRRAMATRPAMGATVRRRPVRPRTPGRRRGPGGPPPTTGADPTTTTAAPTTAAPTTAAPTTAAPTLAAPTLAAPTLAAPTLAAPTTAHPTLAAPTTAHRSTAGPGLLVAGPTTVAGGPTTDAGPTSGTGVRTIPATAGTRRMIRGRARRRPAAPWERRVVRRVHPVHRSGDGAPRPTATTGTGPTATLPVDRVHRAATGMPVHHRPSDRATRATRPHRHRTDTDRAAPTSTAGRAGLTSTAGRDHAPTTIGWAAGSPAPTAPPASR